MPLLRKRVLVVFLQVDRVVRLGDEQQQRHARNVGEHLVDVRVGHVGALGDDQQIDLRVAELSAGLVGAVHRVGQSGTDDVVIAGEPLQDHFGVALARCS